MSEIATCPRCGCKTLIPINGDPTITDCPICNPAKFVKKSGKIPSRFVNTQNEKWTEVEVICQNRGCKFNMANATGLEIFCCELKQVVVSSCGKCMRFEPEK